jgi:hypothetical protein
VWKESRVIPQSKRAFTELVGRPPEPMPTVSKSTIKGTVVDEETLRNEFGLSEPETKRKIPWSYRQLLNLDPQDIINFFDAKVGEYTEFTQVDFIVPASVLAHRIKRLQRVIARSKEIIDGLSVRVMKIRRDGDIWLADIVSPTTL